VARVIEVRKSGKESEDVGDDGDGGCRKRPRERRSRGAGGHAEPLGTDNLEGADNLCAQLRGGGGL